MADDKYKVEVERYRMTRKGVAHWILSMAWDIPKKVKKWGALITIGYLIGILEREGVKLLDEDYDEAKAAKDAIETT